MALRVQQAHIFLRDQGSGPPTLFLHGNPDSADIWDGVVERLQANYRCIAPDLPGFGRSSAPADFDTSFENLGRFVDELVQALAIDEPINVVTHDFGGAFGMAWAATYPEKVRQLVLMDHPFFLGSYRWHRWARIWRTPILGELSMLGMNWPLFHNSLKKGSRKLSTEQIREAYQYVRPELKQMILKLYRSADPERFAAWEARTLQAIQQIPTLVLFGQHDPYIDPSYTKEFGTSNIHIFPDSGHWLPAEEPVAVAKALYDFFGSYATI